MGVMNNKSESWYRKGKRAGYRRGFMDGVMFMMIGTLAMFVALRCAS